MFLMILNVTGNFMSQPESRAFAGVLVAFAVLSLVPISAFVLLTRKKS